jgi:hypothetical protein
MITPDRIAALIGLIMALVLRGIARYAACAGARVCRWC